ncbi:MAG: fibronectin type III domain-containing protein [Thermoplasmatota archaeon]
MSLYHYNTAGSRKMITSTITMLLLLASLLGLFSAFLPERAAGITVPGGILAGNTRWTVSDSPVLLEGNVTIPSGSTLTIDPGVTVQLPPSIGIWVEGKMIARGTESSPINLDKSHASFYFDGINVTGGGYGILEHVIMTGSAGGVKAMGMGSKAYVYNSTLMGNAAGFRGSTSAFAWLVNCTFNAPVNATAASSAEVNEGKWFFFKAISDKDLSGVSEATVKVFGEKYPVELEEWTIFDSAAKGLKTDANGDMPPIAVNQYKHNGQTSSVRVELTMRWELSGPAAYWRHDIKDPGLFVGDNFNLTWFIDKTPPPMPEDLRVGNRTGTTIELLWDLPDPPTDLRWFNIRYKRTNEPLSAMRYVNADDSLRSYIVDSLTHDTLWEFSIQSEDFYANTLGNTSSVLGKTLDIVPPEPPRNFTLKDFGGDWAQFKWNPSPSDDVVGFWIYVKETYGTWNMSKYIDSHMVASDKVTGLPSETNLTAWIAAVDDAETPNIGPPSSNVYFTTLDITPPVAPRLDFFPLETDHYIPGSLYFNTSLVGFKVNVTGEDRTVIEIKLDGKDFVDPDGIIDRWTTYGGVFQYYFFLGEGKHTAMFRSIDPSGNAGPYNSSDIWVDLTPPVMSIEGLEGDTLQFYEGELVDLTLNITDNNDIDDVLWTVSSNYTYEEVHGTSFLKDLDIGSYLLTIKAFDIAGNWNYQEYELIVSIPDLTPPGIISTYPEDGEANIELGPLISVRFSELVMWGSLTPSLVPEGGSAVALNSNLDLDNRTISYYSEDSLLGGTNYTFTLGSIMDLSGNEAPDLVIHFKTISEEDIDTDGDGIPDVYELLYDFLSPSDDTDAAEDYDKDGLTNLVEYQIGTEPDNPDTDEDGIPDGKEVEWGLDPKWASDAQGDLDEDGYTNLEEYEKGSDPTDINSVPEVSDNPSQLWLIILIVVVLVVIIGAVIAALVIYNRKMVKEEQEQVVAPSVGVSEEPTWSEVEELHKKECPFCKASLEEEMTYCPECGMDLPEDVVEEGSMDEDQEEGLPMDIPMDELSDMAGAEIEPPERDMDLPDNDLEPEIDEDMEPPTMDEVP